MAGDFLKMFLFSFFIFVLCLLYCHLVKTQKDAEHKRCVDFIWPVGLFSLSDRIPTQSQGKYLNEQYFEALKTAQAKTKK